MKKDEILEKLDRENIKIASLGKRSLAYVIDDIIITLIVFAIYFENLQSLANGSDPEALVFFISQITLQIYLLKFLYQTFFTWYYGASLGKIIMKIYCIDARLLSKPNLINSAIRAFFRILGEVLFFVSFLWAFSDETKRTLHDLLAQSVVCDVG